MKIVVAIKQVPESNSAITISTDSAWIDETNLQWTMNESDAYALEQALNLKETHGGEVVALSAGPERVCSSLREALAKGADRAIHVEINDLAQRDALNVAQILAEAIRSETPDLVLTGLQSEDLGYGQTGVLLAELLDLPHASLILEIEKYDASIRVKCELEEGWFQTIELSLPALLTIQSGGVKLRYATLMGIKRAKTKELHRISAAELNIAPAQSFRLESVAPPQKQKSTQMLSGSAQEAARALVDKLRLEARVL